MVHSKGAAAQLVVMVLENADLLVDRVQRKMEASKNTELEVILPPARSSLHPPHAVWWRMVDGELVVQRSHVVQATTTRRWTS
jgi:hypothetical protein